MSRIQDIADKLLIMPNIEDFLRNPDNREESSKLLAHILERCFSWKAGILNPPSKEEYINKMKDNNITVIWAYSQEQYQELLMSYLKEDLELANEINKILLEVDNKLSNESFDKINSILTSFIKENLC